MHQYLDSDGSGTSATCVSSTIGAERLADATNWLKTNNKKGFLGEIGAGNNGSRLPYTLCLCIGLTLADVCVTAVYGAMCALQQAGGVWLGGE